MNYDELQIELGQPEYERNFIDFMKGNKHAEDKLTKGYNKGQGTYSLPYVASKKCDGAITDESTLRQLCTVIDSTSNMSHLFVNDAEEIAEYVGEGDLIHTHEFEQGTEITPIKCHKLTILVRAAEDFVHQKTFDVEGLITGRLARAFARGEDQGFLNGSGTDEPRGLLSTESAEIGVTTSTLTYDDVIKLYFSVKPKYRKNGSWLMNDETAFALRTLKDADGNYLWNANDNTILGKPVFISEFMPNAESGKKPILFGDFSYYWIIRRSGVSVRPLTEVFAKWHQVGYLAHEYLDGLLSNKEAIKSLTMSK